VAGSGGPFADHNLIMNLAWVAVAVASAHNHYTPLDEQGSILVVMEVLLWLAGHVALCCSRRTLEVGVEQHLI
jgi:hypothetical protein